MHHKYETRNIITLSYCDLWPRNVTDSVAECHRFVFFAEVKKKKATFAKMLNRKRE